MEPSALFSANLPLIEQVLDGVCRRARLQHADAEDFASVAKLALLEDDYAILRKWEGRSSLGGYLTAVFQRLLLSERVRAYGRWRESAEAQRMGRAGMLLERLIRRDGRSIDEAWPLIRGVDPNLTRADVDAMAERLRARMPRPRPVEIETIEEFAEATDRADAAVDRDETQQLSQRISEIVRDVLADVPLEERMMLKFRFAGGMTAPAIARALQVPQRTVYRRIDMLLERIRRALRRGGVAERELAGIIGADDGILDFGFETWQGAAVRPSEYQELSRAEEP